MIYENDTGLLKISRELHKHSAAIDFLDEPRAKQVINAALKVVRRELNASIVELYFLSTTLAPTKYGDPSEYVPCLQRSDWDAYDNILKSRIKQKPIYELFKEDNGSWANPGVWSWVYEHKRPVWVEDMTYKTADGCVVNQLGEKNEEGRDLHKLSEEYTIVYPKTQCIIVVPFNHKIEHANDTDIYGILSVEFEDVRRYTRTEYEAIKSIANCFADLRWKSKAWQENWKGTKEVTEDIIDFCNQFHESTKAGLFIPFGSLLADLGKDVEASFAEQSSRMDIFDTGRNEIIRSHQELLMDTKTHFAIIDVTNCDPTNIFLLGCMVSQKKPCLILAEQSSDNTVPPFVPWLTSRKQSDSGQIIRFCTYRKDPNGAVSLFCPTTENADEGGIFDVFLCHNSEDKSLVKEIGEQLKHLGLRPWLDQWDSQPGKDWQGQLEDVLKHSRSVAVFVGPSGQGPWQRIELRNSLIEFVDRGLPIIPVILRGVKDKPELPPFLRTFGWVDFRESDPDPMNRLMWGISGEKSAGGTKASSWGEVWEEFIRSVRKQSPVFRSANNYVP